MKIWNINKADRREIKYVNLSSMPVFKVAQYSIAETRAGEGPRIISWKTVKLWHETQVSSLLCYEKNAREKNKTSLERT